MKLNIYAVYDVVSESSGDLFICKNDELAIRAFNRYIDDAAKKDNYFNPTDYRLLRLGIYDNEASENLYPSIIGCKTVNLDLAKEV